MTPGPPDPLYRIVYAGRDGMDGGWGHVGEARRTWDMTLRTIQHLRDRSTRPPGRVLWPVRVVRA